MKSRQHPEFARLFSELDDIRQKRARKALEQWKVNPAIRGLGWHVLKGALAPIYSMHIGLYDRAVALVTKDTDGKPAATWLWIGSHEEYNGWIETNKPRNLITWTESKAWSHVVTAEGLADRLDQRAQAQAASDVPETPRAVVKSRHGKKGR